VQSPPLEHLIRSADLEPVSLALEIVLKEDRIREDVHGRGGSRRSAAQVVVVIVERGDGSRELRPDCCAPANARPPPMVPSNAHASSNAALRRARVLPAPSFMRNERQLRATDISCLLGR
jgi:hypothetical protein